MPELIVPDGLVCGIDEAGRGPLAGPVVAAAVILDPARPIAGLNDSKKLSEKKRDALAALIREQAVAWCVAEASVEEIDRLNILHATMLAMQRAVAGLAVRECVATVRTGKLSTNEAIVDASGTIDMAQERLNLHIKPESLQWKFFSLRTPLYVRGSFANPDVGVEPGPLLLRAGAAIAAAVVAPAACLM